MRSSGVLRTVIGIAISIVALAWVLSQADLARTADALRRVEPGWIAAMLGFQALDLLLRAWRWQRLLHPIKPIRYVRMLEYLLIGYLANNILPARLGELVRSHYVGDREGVSRTTTLGTVVVERVVDTAVVVLLASLAIFVLHISGVVASAVLIGLALTGLLIVGLAVGVAAHRLPGAERVVAMIARWPRVAELAGKLRGGLAVAGRPRVLAETVVISFAAWGCTVVAFLCAGQALGIQMTAAQASLLAAGTALVAAIPAGPSNLGTFDLAAVEILASYGLPRGEGLALALIAHASILVITSLGGAIALARVGWARTSARSDTGVDAGEAD